MDMSDMDPHGMFNPFGHLHGPELDDDGKARAALDTMVTITNSGAS